MPEKVATILDRAFDATQRDARFRVIALSCAMQAVQEHPDIDPERAREAASDIALQAVAHLLQRIYEEDAELRALRAELDHWKKVARIGLHCVAPPLIVMKEKDHA